MHLLAERFFFWVIMGVFWKRESRPTKWYQRRLSTCQHFFCLHIWNLWSPYLPCHSFLSWILCNQVYTFTVIFASWHPKNFDNQSCLVSQTNRKWRLILITLALVWLGWAWRSRSRPWLSPSPAESRTFQKLRPLARRGRGWRGIWGRICGQPRNGWRSPSRWTVGAWTPLSCLKQRRQTKNFRFQERTQLGESGDNLGATTFTHLGALIPYFRKS